MSAPDPDDLERRLTELFGQRAATITQVRQFDAGPGDGRRKPAGLEPGRDRWRWQHLGVLAAAAAVFVAVAATIVAIQASRPRPAPPLGTSTATPTASSAPTNATPTPTPTNASCWVEAPASWLQAITAGAFRGDNDLNTVVSANGGTGDYLVTQGNAPTDQTSQIYADLELALYHDTRGNVIYTAQGSKDFVQADPTGAISAGWVTFAVVSPQNSADYPYRYQVMLYQRGTGTLRTLAGGADQPNPERKLVRGAPVIAAGKVYWLASVDNHPETTTLESWDLSRNSAAASRNAADATGLVGYGSGVAVMYESVSESSAITATLRNGAGVPLTKAQLDATTGGSNFGFDGTSKLSWLRYDGDSASYSVLIVGGTGVSTEPLSHAADRAAGTLLGISAAVFPFVAAVVHNVDGLVDLRTGTPVAFPIGTIVQAVVGDSVVFGTDSHNSGQAFGSAGLSLVPLSALPAAHC